MTLATLFVTRHNNEGCQTLMFWVLGLREGKPTTSGSKAVQYTITVYHITSRPKKQAFLGPITKLVAKLVARHKTSRIKGI